MNLYKHLSIAGVATAALFAGQAMASTCPTAPGNPNAQTQGGPVCIAPQGADGAGTGLQDQLDSMTTGGPGIDVYNDQYQPNAYWQIGATGSSENQFLFQIAGNSETNTFGIFDYSDPSNSLQLFSGDAGTGWSTSLKIIDDTYIATYFDENGLYINQDSVTLGSSKFGYYLDTEADGTFYSDHLLNPGTGDSNYYEDGAPQMVAYKGNDQTKINNGQHTGTFLTSEYILAWEDTLWANSDLDYNDFVVMVESVHPVPEPAELAILAFGLVLIGSAVGVRRRRSDRS